MTVVSDEQYFIYQEGKIIMTYMLNSIDEAVDRKFLVTKSLSNQVKAGTLVHIMGTKEIDDGVVVDYRVTDTGQDFSIRFAGVKEFCQWARPDTFIARYYESFSQKEILHYIKVNNRSFVNFCLPIILGVVVVAIILALIIKGTVGVIVAVVLSIAGVAASMFLYNSQKKNVKLKLYQKVSTNWGIAFK